MTDTAELRKLAEAATPGPWVHHYPSDNPLDCFRVFMPELPYAGAETIGDSARAIDDARFISAFNPQTAIALLDEIAALKEKVKRQAEALKPWANLAEQCGFPYNDNDPVLITNGVDYVKHAFTVGDLRRAAQEAGHE